MSLAFAMTHVAQHDGLRTTRTNRLSLHDDNVVLGLHRGFGLQWSVDVLLLDDPTRQLTSVFGGQFSRFLSPHDVRHRPQRDSIQLSDQTKPRETRECYSLV